jgi:hypothetical protein
MGIEHRADGGQVDRVIMNDDDGPRWGRGGPYKGRFFENEMI